MMSHYAVVDSWKFVLADLHKELNALKKAEPTAENLAAVKDVEKDVEKRANEVANAIRLYKAAHGIAA